MEAALNNLCMKLFYPFLAPLFAPINRFLNQYYQPYAFLCAIGMFVGTMIWVAVILDAKYVNRGCPYKSVWSDLRLWTVLSMMPHVLFYLYFR